LGRSTDSSHVPTIVSTEEEARKQKQQTEDEEQRKKQKAQEVENAKRRKLMSKEPQMLGDEWENRSLPEQSVSTFGANLHNVDRNEEAVICGTGEGALPCR
jgi:hypothetical protein